MRGGHPPAVSTAVIYKWKGQSRRGQEWEGVRRWRRGRSLTGHLLPSCLHMRLPTAQPLLRYRKKDGRLEKILNSSSSKNSFFSLSGGAAPHPTGAASPPLVYWKKSRRRSRESFHRRVVDGHKEVWIQGSRWEATRKHVPASVDRIGCLLVLHHGLPPRPPRHTLADGAVSRHP